MPDGPKFARLPLGGVAIAALAGLASAIVWIAGAVVEQRSLDDLRAQARAAATLHAAVLRSELDKQRALPLVLADDDAVRAALATRAPAQLEAVSRKLELLAGQTRAAAIYVVAPDGRALAASNWRQPQSFVGVDYRFRPYFQEALRAGQAEQFALGSISRRPGLYLTRRISGAGAVLGVVVVKIEFDGVETAWRALGEPAFVTDGQGLVLLTSEPAWRFATRSAWSPESRAALRAAGQFGNAAFAPLPLRETAPGQVARLDAPGSAAQIETRLEPVAPGWTLHLLSSTRPAAEAAIATRWIAALLCGLAGLLLLWLRARRVRARQAADLERQSRLDLERRVGERTLELTQANAALSHEVEERRRAEDQLRTLQADLVQANKLASLGQIAAGVAHEINQPLSAIRAYADNGAVLLDRGRPEAARENLATIGEMTERIGQITEELRAFARKADGRVEPTLVSEVIDGSILLTASRSRRQDAALSVPRDLGDLKVLGERVRLEQVLVNLLQNAFEAVDGRPGAQVTLEVEDLDAWVEIAVADNGPGLASEVEQSLFTPFLTTKSKGLGLGLVIARDIAADFGGELLVRSGAREGARFVLRLRKAAS